MIITPEKWTAYFGSAETFGNTPRVEVRAVAQIHKEFQNMPKWDNITDPTDLERYEMILMEQIDYIVINDKLDNTAYMDGVSIGAFSYGKDAESQETSIKGVNSAIYDLANYLDRDGNTWDFLGVQ
jgi:hypothetical protein